MDNLKKILKKLESGEIKLDENELIEILNKENEMFKFSEIDWNKIRDYRINRIKW